MEQDMMKLVMDEVVKRLGTNTTASEEKKILTRADC